MVRHPSLPERDRRILEAVVSAYIEQGEPVSSCGSPGGGWACRRRRCGTCWRGSKSKATCGSRTPRRAACRPISATATTSTAFLSERRSYRTTPNVEARLRQAGTVDDLLAHVSQEVSRASHQVGFAIAPSSDTTTLEHLNFVLLDGGKILVVLVAAGGHVSHKLIEPSEPYTQAELQHAANYLNSEFRGRTLVERAPGGARAAARGALALRRADGAGAAARQHDAGAHRFRAGRIRAGHVDCCSTTSAATTRTSRSRPCARYCR